MYFNGYLYASKIEMWYYKSFFWIPLIYIYFSIFIQSQMWRYFPRCIRKKTRKPKPNPTRSRSWQTSSTKTLIIHLDITMISKHFALTKWWKYRVENFRIFWPLFFPDLSFSITLSILFTLFPSFGLVFFSFFISVIRNCFPIFNLYVSVYLF